MSWAVYEVNSVLSADHLYSDIQYRICKKKRLESGYLGSDLCADFFLSLGQSFLSEFSPPVTVRDKRLQVFGSLNTPTTHTSASVSHMIVLVKMWYVLSYKHFHKAAYLVVCVVLAVLASSRKNCKCYYSEIMERSDAWRKRIVITSDSSLKGDNVHLNISLWKVVAFFLAILWTEIFSLQPEANTHCAQN